MLGPIKAVWKYFSMNPRLFIEYSLIVAVVLLASATYSLWLHKQIAEVKIEGLEKDVSIVKSVNETQQKSIEKLTSLRKIDDEAMSNLEVAINRIRENKGSKDAALQILRDRDNQVDTYLRGIVPPDLARLYGRAQDDARSGDPNRSGETASPPLSAHPPARSQDLDIHR